MVVSGLGALSCTWNFRRVRSQLLPCRWNTPTTPVTGFRFHTCTAREEGRPPSGGGQGRWWSNERREADVCQHGHRNAPDLFHPEAAE